ncbi:uncharacterized protein L969DRAFT_46321 [Mixia osmundae IAM 14324]|uniref:Uncharacterized protein n=1 Tax=Mixia osmundae (strain CBS 9802 / IAM 14324 / JCM 22182 / KY 12970) TaxID=764103 RepID=G7E5U3_MIXOS|nr:uncharacterized protein L969DRAFT_46321 [Mixia osmundae IAM 14324]KEI40645.1 hypothetical protein L969DRAFT_46321 [Mixia osmundae IAM 14324]GAA98203.1 hypothetical protein E5Q_04886 [Mixia osmundae IAM 14324]
MIPPALRDQAIRWLTQKLVDSPIFQEGVHRSHGIWRSLQDDYQRAISESQSSEASSPDKARNTDKAAYESQTTRSNASASHAGQRDVDERIRRAQAEAQARANAPRPGTEPQGQANRPPPPPPKREPSAWQTLPPKDDKMSELAAFLEKTRKDLDHR